MNFEYQDYPCFYKIFDRYSLEGQKKYLLWIRIELLILIITSLIGLFPFAGSKVLPILSSITFVLVIGVTFLIKYRKFEDDWYIGRAITESIKSLTWKYLVKGEPFGNKVPISDEEIDKRFNNLLKEIIKENKSFLKVSYPDDDGIVISDKMLSIRKLSFNERKLIYIEERVKNQRDWYITKAKSNKVKSNYFFWGIICIQFIAFVYSLILIKNSIIFNIVPLMTTIAVSLLTWLQVKQHQELSQSYAVAVNDINLILCNEKYINDEEKFEVFVADSENAFSREHTLWIARKDVFKY